MKIFFNFALVILILVAVAIAPQKSYAGPDANAMFIGLIGMGAAVVLAAGGVIGFIIATDDTDEIKALPDIFRSIDPALMPEVVFVFKDGRMESGFVSMALNNNNYTGIDSSGKERTINPNEIGFVYLPETDTVLLSRDTVMLRESGICLDAGPMTISSYSSNIYGIAYSLRISYPLSLNTECGLLLAYLDYSEYLKGYSANFDTRFYLDRYRRGLFFQPSLCFEYNTYDSQPFGWALGLVGRIGLTIDVGFINLNIAAGWQENIGFKGGVFDNPSLDGRAVIYGSVGLNFGRIMAHSEYIEKMNN